MDLHCHDHNSNVPDELLGRILNVPETWLPTKSLLRTLGRHGMDAFTITNHNNARSCFELLNKGHDILVGAEFSCIVPDFQVGIHVLTYGFTPSQEEELNRRRKNLYEFLDFTSANDLPTIWAHPLYHYTKSGTPSPDFYRKLVLLFDRFEALNGQRDTWQNMLVRTWIESLTEEKVDDYSKQFGIDPARYCRSPYRKSLSGGSDSHMGIFSGLTGSRLYVPGLQEKRKNVPLSQLALQAIREGNLNAFGMHNNGEKMMITFLDYACQIALYSKDPGLMRVLLHKGEPTQKITALLVANAFAELRQHKVTMSFISLFHNSLTGKQPDFTKRWLIPQPYKPIFDEVRKMARTFRTDPGSAVETYTTSIGQIYDHLGLILDKKVTSKLKSSSKNEAAGVPDLNVILAGLEVPGLLRTYLDAGNGKSMTAKDRKNGMDFTGFLDGLSFPFLASSVILGAHFTSTKVLYNNREQLSEFSRELGILEHPKRMLWLTDTWDDRNGVSMVLLSVLREIRERDLPIDIMVCSNTLESADHLIVVRPQSEIETPFYKNQKLRIPNFLEIHHKFLEGEYDRIMCSTEGGMGLAALYLKQAYTVKAYFYMHTDWKTFARKVLNLEKENLSRLVRLLRAFYKAFDGVFVLNTDHYKWLTNKKMALDKEKVFLTAHWPGKDFIRLSPDKERLFGIGPETPVMLYAGRISEEKGVMELPDIYLEVERKIPGVRMVIAGAGPAESKLKTVMPQASYLGWVDSANLPAIYSSADLLVFPSKFDTFSCAVLESLASGLPVIAYNTKGPKDILWHGVNGFLVSDHREMIDQTIDYFRNPASHESMRKAAVGRSADYRPDSIMERLLEDTGLEPKQFLNNVH
jgi:glycosyltransferase involved in cell wall biosynthesis